MRRLKTISYFGMPVLMLLLFGSVAAAHADAINYSFTGNGSGTIGADTFTDATFDVSINADTFDVAYQSDLLTLGVENLTGTIDIAGVGTASFTDPLYVFDYSDEVGFGNFSVGDLITTSDASLVGYGLTSDFGPVSSSNDSLSQFNDVSTSLGSLTYTSMGDVTFVASTAVATPEPGTIGMTLVGIGLLGLMMVMRRRLARGLPQAA
jgi:hypothetical protein